MLDNTRHTAGLRLLENILEEKDWEILSDNGIRDDEFQGDAKKALKFVREYYLEYNEFPPKDVVEDSKIIFPSKTPLDFSLKKFKDYQLSKELTDLVTKSRDYIVKGDPQSALGVLVSGVTNRRTSSKLESFKKTGKLRHDNYVLKKKTGISGIVPPWETLREAITVWETKTLNAVLGESSTGKSWALAVASAMAAFTQGEIVLHVSMENSKESIDSRLDALYYKLPFGDMRKGLLDMRAEEYWINNLPKLDSEKGDIIVVDDTKVKTVADIQQLVSVYNPAFVVVDGAYKLKGSGSDNFAQTSDVLLQLHQAAGASKAAWLASSQLNPGATDAHGGRATANKARGNKNWYIDPATVLTITQTPDQLLLNQVECIVAKIREAGDVTGMNMEFIMVQDRKRMEFYELDEYTNQDIVDMTI